MDAATDSGVDGRWMSYAELAELRRIDKPSALKLAIRRKWLRRKDNHGTMQVCVPTEWLMPFGAGTPRGMPPAAPSAVADQAFEAAISSLTAAREQAEKRADEALSTAERERSRADRAEARADQAEAGRDSERARADALRDRIEATEAQLAAAEQAAEQARRQAQEARDAAEILREADAVRKGRGRLARLKAAWRAE